MSLQADDVLRVVASMLWTDGNVNQNVFNCKLSGSGAPWADDDIIDDCEDWLDDMYLNLTSKCSDEIDGNEVIIYVYDTAHNDWDEVGSQSWVWNPTNAADQLPRGVAALVRLWTYNADVQGKKYIPALCEDGLVDGLFNAALITAFLGFAADWYTPFVGAASGATFSPGVWSVVDIAFRLGLDHFATSTIPAYQRRRKRTVGI